MKTKLMRFLPILFLFMGTGLVAQQARTITGTVTDNADSTPIPGVNIVVKGTARGVTSDFDGNYSIEVDDGEILVFTYIGYTDKEIAVEGQNVIDVSLEVSTAQLDEVVVIGYGTQKKSDLTGSVSTVSFDDLATQPNSNFAQALQGGNVPGAFVALDNAGAEQADLNILVRGRNSITASNKPLIVLDGIIYNGNFSDINPNDIQSLSVLRDASSTAIYGARGSNGVILITSKKGRAGKLNVSFNTFSAANMVGNLPDVYDGPGFAAFKENREPGQFSQTEVDNLLAGREVDWLDLGLRGSFTNEYNLSVSGGTEKISFLVSAGYHKADGILLGDDFERTSLRANVDAQVSKNLKVGTSVLLTRINRSGVGVNLNSSENGLFFANPLGNAFEENGDLTINPWPEDIFFTNALGNTLVSNEDISYKIFTSNFVEYQIPVIEGLSYRMNIGGEYRTRNNNTYYPRTMQRGLQARGEAVIDTEIDDNLLVENVLTYKRQFGDHNFDFTALYSTQKENREDVRFVGTGFVSDDLTFRQLPTAEGGIIAPAGDENRQRELNFVSQMGRLNYGYQNKYLATFTVRRDAFSGFGKDSKYGTFFSGALAWKISDEDFFNSDGFVNNLKLRLTYGESGNSAVGAFERLGSLQVFSTVNDTDNLAAGYVVNDLPNQLLTWETTATTNIGFDIGLWNNRINMTVDGYIGNTEDLLLNREIPIVNGDDRVNSNVGKTRNSGFEIGLNSTLINKEDFSWGLSGSFAYNKNEIVSLVTGNQDDVANELFIGQPVRVNYGLAFDGIWQVGDDIANSAQTSAVPGDVRVLDVANTVVDADGNIVVGISAEDDRIVQGQRDPKFNYGISTNLRYKNLSLTISGNGVGGVTRRNSVLDVNPFGGVRRNVFVTEFWTPDNPINTFHRNNVNANIFEVRFYEKADFFRLRDVTLAYDIKSKFLGDGSAKIFLTGRNLWTITNYGGIDPELGLLDDDLEDGESAQRVPNQSQIVLGLNLNF